MSKETDYLVKMYEKYCPTKEVEGITCFTKEGMEWFDSIIKLKRASETLEIIIKKDVDVALLKGILHSNKSLHTASYYNSLFVATYRHLTQEEFDTVKEVLI